MLMCNIMKTYFHDFIFRLLLPLWSIHESSFNCLGQREIEQENKREARERERERETERVKE